MASARDPIEPAALILYNSVSAAFQWCSSAPEIRNAVQTSAR
jgi:hypothetical protein